MSVDVAAGLRGVRGTWLWVGLGVAVALPVVGYLVPTLTGWQVATRAPRSAVAGEVAPLHGYWGPTAFGPGTLPAVLLAILAWRYGFELAERLTWRRLLVTAYAVSLAWLLALALVRGQVGIAGVISGPYEYLPSVRAIGHSPGDVHRLLQTYVDRIPYAAAPRNWPTQLAGHPPGMVLFFVLLAALGLGDDLGSGLGVVVVAASIGVAVLVTLRALGAEAAGRRAAPYLVLSPTAVFLAVSGDAVISAVVAWGLACLAIGATSASRRRLAAYAGLAGLLLGYAVLMSYGMPLAGFIAVAVLISARRWSPLPIAAVAATIVVLVFAVLGFRWWEAYPVLRERYYDGIAMDRPLSYWAWGDVGALVLSAGPLLGAGLAAALSTAREAAARSGARVVLLLTGATVLALALADASGMSKAETERIWLPFAAWLTVSCALLPDRWRRPGLAVQLGTALLVEHLVHTVW